MAITITSASQLAQIGISPGYPGNQSYILGNDITITGAWTTLPSANGLIFDGNGHRISTLTMPLFSRLYNARVSNLTLVLNIDTTGIAYPNGYGGVGGLVQTASACDCTNITIEGRIAGQWAVGGIIGDTNSADFIDCVNYAAVTTTWGRGGGLTSLGSECNFIRCINHGKVTVIGAPEAYSTSWAGGIAGILQVSGYYPEEPFFIQVADCVNYGNIESYAYGGGIAGWILAYTPFAGIEIRNCHNHGPVSPSSFKLAANEGSQFYGGITGSVLYGGDILDCTNDAPVSGGGSVGGIAGNVGPAYLYEFQQEYLKANLARCRNSGSVTLTVPAFASLNSDAYRYAGGISGTLFHGGTVVDSWNAGMVSSNAPYTGGIVGSVIASVVEGCTNEAAVAGALHTGGIAGAVDPQPSFRSPALMDPASYVARLDEAGRRIGAAENNAGPVPMPATSGVGAPGARRYGPVAAAALPPAPVEAYALLRGNVNARSARVSATGNNTGGIAGLVRNGARVLDNKSCGEVVSGGSSVGGVVGHAEHALLTSPNEITDNLVSAPTVSGMASVYRVLGANTSQIPVSMHNTQVFPNVLLTGNNTGDGGFVYNDQPVLESDPQLGAALRQGATLVCPPGERPEECVGCVPTKCPPGQVYVPGVGCVEETRPPRPCCPRSLCCSRCACRPPSACCWPGANCPWFHGMSKRAFHPQQCMGRRV